MALWGMRGTPERSGEISERASDHQSTSPSPHAPLASYMAHRVAHRVALND